MTYSSRGFHFVPAMGEILIPWLRKDLSNEEVVVQILRWSQGYDFPPPLGMERIGSF
jgi:hypothetical protein